MVAPGTCRASPSWAPATRPVPVTPIAGSATGAGPADVVGAGLVGAGLGGGPAGEPLPAAAGGRAGVELHPPRRTRRTAAATTRCLTRAAQYCPPATRSTSRQVGLSASRVPDSGRTGREVTHGLRRGAGGPLRRR